jgi:hypothetical protein
MIEMVEYKEGRIKRERVQAGKIIRKALVNVRQSRRKLNESMGHRTRKDLYTK